MRIKTLTKRASFVTVASKGTHIRAKGLVLQALPQQPASCSDTVYVGFTATKKVGNAVKRNRVKRRLRAVIRNIAQTSPQLMRSDTHYVYIGKKTTLERDFIQLVKDARYCLHQLTPS